jgi:hypothetical protein
VHDDRPLGRADQDGDRALEHDEERHVLGALLPQDLAVGETALAPDRREARHVVVGEPREQVSPLRLVQGRRRRLGGAHGESSRSSTKHHTHVSPTSADVMIG